jgi:5-methylcytosine-specific restriction endonuclease McrA
VAAAREKYRVANPEKEKARRTVYRAENREEIRAKKAAYRAVNPEKIKSQEAAYRANSREKFAVRRKEYRLRNLEKVKALEAASRARNKEKRAAHNVAWRADNPDKVRAINRNRHARKRMAEGHNTAEDIQRIYTAQNGKCAYCKVKLNNKFHVDHIVPLAKGGSNWPANLQLTCGPCNSRKKDRDPLDHARELGMLL